MVRRSAFFLSLLLIAACEPIDLPAPLAVILDDEFVTPGGNIATIEEAEIDEDSASAESWAIIGETE